MEKMYWTGIGSRETPSDVLILQQIFATNLTTDLLAKNILPVFRSGKAIGSDQAFQRGNDYAFSKMGIANPSEIYLSEPTWNMSDNDIVGSDTLFWPQTRNIVKDLHPAWNKIVNKKGELLHRRNILQVVGQDGITPSDFVIYWADVNAFGQVQGGTATAANFASNMNIPTFNIHTGKGCQKVAEMWAKYTRVNHG